MASPRKKKALARLMNRLAAEAAIALEEVAETPEIIETAEVVEVEEEVLEIVEVEEVPVKSRRTYKRRSKK
tara:strand:- start:4763 stop:4975 length:213 start_codon:yes stop_codon:yes gene_type:complete